MPAEAVVIGIAKLNENDKEEWVYYKEFKPLIEVDDEAYQTHGLGMDHLARC